MSGRNRRPHHADSYRGFHGGGPPVLTRGPGPLPVNPAAFEEEFELQHRDIQRLIMENRYVIEENSILQREMTAAKDEIHRLSQVIPKIRADKEAQTRELIERGMKLEAELRAAEPLRAEVMQLRVEAQKLDALHQELSSQAKGLKQDVSRLQAENHKLTAMRADIDGMHKELSETRRAYEYEKKANSDQMEQKEAMEKNLISMAREIEKLRAEQLNGERRARGFGSGGYGMLNGSPEMRGLSSRYGDGYGGAWGGSYDKRGPSRR